MSFELFKQDFYEKILPNKPEYIREGQTLINYLGDIWVEEYKRISSNHFYDDKYIDCFFNDKLIPNTLEHLEKIWNNYPN